MYERETFYWGVPIKKSDIDNYKESLYQRYKSEKSQYDIELMVVSHLNSILDRITNKSSALLQANSMLAAVMAIFAYQLQYLSLLTSIFSKLTFIAILVSCLLLILNLTIVWPKDFSLFSTPEKEINHTLTLIKKRILRFTISIILAALTLTSSIFMIIASIIKN